MGTARWRHCPMLYPHFPDVRIASSSNMAPAVLRQKNTHGMPAAHTLTEVVASRRVYCKFFISAFWDWPSVFPLVHVNS